MTPNQPGMIGKEQTMTGSDIVQTSKPCSARKLELRFVAEVTLTFPGISS